ncbi:TonB-dependent receptor [Pedobacter sp. PWIIR3]
MKKISALSLLLLCFCTCSLLAQTNRKVSGSVIDSAKTGISNATILLISGQDTLSTETDSFGDFRFSKVTSNSFTIQITSFGYIDQEAQFSFHEKEKHKKLGAFIIKVSKEMLKEVEITAKANPMRFMKDTVEFNAGAFQVNEGDNVADLLKQLPGVQVDENYNATTMGKSMKVLRVNGKTFFTSDVNEFIKTLPAGIVSKMQIIDDFGDQANFTGIKIGEPRKILNLITKPGMDNGSFGRIYGSAGTNEMIGSSAELSRWKNTKQSSVSLNGNTANNGAGNSRSLGVGINHNDKISEFMEGRFNYNFYNNGNAFSQEQVSESINPEGKFNTNSQSQGDNKGNNHRLNIGTNYNNKKVFIESNIGGSYNQSDNSNSSLVNQYGLLRQDLKSRNSSGSSAPSLSGSASFSKKLKNNKNSFTGQSSFSFANNNSDQNINTNTRYYNKDSGDLLKDSVLNRNLTSKSANSNFEFGFNYSIGLKKPKDSLARQSLNISYNASAGNNTNEVSTFVFDNKSNRISFVDSLSTSFSTVNFNQSVGANYNYDSNKGRYNIAVNARPNLLTNRDLRLRQKIQINNFNFSPSVNYSKTLTQGKTVSLNYYGSTRNPDISQLQPIRNAQNLQNIVVGNPELKASFHHNLNANFNYSQLKTGRSLQLGINSSATQREIVSNVSLVSDTLNSLKQITRYQNVNGNYQINGNYFIYAPFRKNKYSIRYSGALGFSNRAVIFNNEKVYGKGLNFSQNLSGTFTGKKLTLNTQTSYAITNNNNSNSLYGAGNYQSLGIGQIGSLTFFRTTTLGANIDGNLRLPKFSLRGGVNYNNSKNSATTDQPLRNTSTVTMNITGRMTIRKSYFVNFSTSKQINYGYAFANTNPLVINAGLEKSFFKDRSLNMGISANDLLNQGNNISRMVAGNTVIDSRSNQITRVFSVNLNYNLSRFGGKNFRVDAD